MNQVMQSIISGLDGLIFLSSDSASLKTEFFYLLCLTTMNSGQQIDYLDYDLQFSSYLENLPAVRGFHLPPSPLLSLRQPDAGSAKEDIIGLVSEEMREGGLLILDSLNTFQNVIRRENLDADSIRANREAAILITILQQAARRFSKTIWISSLTRERPSTGAKGEVLWEREPAGGRMMYFKSDAFVSLNPPRDLGDTSCEVKMKWRRKQANGREAVGHEQKSLLLNLEEQ